MADEGVPCPKCGAIVPAEALVCPECHALIDGGADPPASAPDPVATVEEVAPKPPPVKRPARAAGPPSPNPFATDLNRRLTRLNQWAEAVQPLGVELPRLPGWADETARGAANPEPWAEVVRGIERLAQRRVVEAFDDWEKRTKSRLTRLEAYSVDSRLERDQIDEALHAARGGDVAAAISAYQQVDRVVTLKERHLDQAREELEKVISLLHDMSALGIEPPQDATEIADDLESELRAGKLAALKQQIRAIRLQAVTRLKAGLPQYISEYGDYLLSERAHGIATELEAIDLARGAREFFRGRPEDGVRRLRGLQQRHGLPPNRPARAPSRNR